MICKTEGIEPLGFKANRLQKWQAEMVKNLTDPNGDGFITVDELKAVLSSLGLKQGKTLDDCKKMIMQVDGDGDGRVNFKEFRQMMKGGGFSALG
ncbi:hypothetical protein F2Q69_00058264 [Brassica cretica]|uniref:EF-hand domain-containing protein n=1 Tax=Brassica cretica TaxID=69181 RepID=A0A8S9RPB9_BRACR|nr:hypothetical protein F2Q69_00058264 [Brassica cretica]